MASLILSVVIVLVVSAFACYTAGHRMLAYWLLILSPGLLCSSILWDLARGAAQIGQAAIEGDHEQLAFCFILLSLSASAALRPKWPWVFWAAWTSNALACAILLYVIVSWRVV